MVLGLVCCGDDVGTGLADATVDGSSEHDAGEPIECAPAIVCPDPAVGRATICGYLIDAETNQRFREANPDAADCDSIPAPTDGPCALAVDTRDGVEFLESPASSTALAAQIAVDRCGRFRVQDLEVPSSGHVAITVGDAPDASGVVVSAHVTAIAAGDRLVDYRAYVVRTTTDADWTSAALSPFGAATFSEHGAHLAIFLSAADPVSGVTITTDGTERPEFDYYFADIGDRRSIVDPALDATGTNGSGLMVDTSVTTHSGSGGERGGCSWSRQLAGSPPGVIAVGDYRLELDGGPCP